MRTYAKTYLVKHGKGFRYKRRVPGDVQDAIGKNLWLRYLGDTGKANAERLARKLAVGHDELIAGLRKLAPTERQAFIAGGGLQALEATADDKGAAFVDAVARYTEPDLTDPEEVQAHDALVIVRALKDAQKMRADAKEARKLLARLKPSSLQPDSVESLIPVWVARNKPRSDETMRLHVRRFVEVVGDIPARQVTRQHVGAFRDALEASPKLSRISVSKHLDSLHALFKAALSALAVDHNPAADIKVSKAGGKFSDEMRKLPFSAENVRAIIKAMEGESVDTQWMLRLLAYTGARSGELAQLRCEDVTTLEGIPVLRIHDKHGPLKNKFSVRDIPIPPACIGIVAYAASVRGPWLFGSFPAWGKRSRGATFQRLAGPFLRRKVKITDAELTLHSFRHRWRTIAREIDMPEPVSKAIMGHAMGAGDHGAYGSVPSLAKRAQWIAKVDPLA